MSSGLYSELARAGLLIPHTEEDADSFPAEGVYKLLRPDQLEFISYPYEWCFSQLRDAARLTLEIQERALRDGMSLKDASAFNVQFRMAGPLFLDTLSLERDDGGPWVAYEQFCRQFLAPLLLCTEFPDANRHFRVDLDGFPLAAVSRALSWRTYFRPGPLLHIHLHARAQRFRADHAVHGWGTGGGPNTKAVVARSLTRAIERLRSPNHKQSERSGFEISVDRYGADSNGFVMRYIQSAVRKLRPRLVYELGGGTGAHARLIASEGCRCVLYDSDTVRIDQAYREERAAGSGLVLPLVMDLRNPSPALGFGLEERQSLLERPAADLVLGLSLLHNLRLHDSIPFVRLADLLSKLGRALLVEFVPVEDPIVARMIARRGYVPNDYSHQGFVSAFSRRFRLLHETRIPGMDRRLFLFRG